MSDTDPMRWMWRGVIGVTLLIGWLFIFWHNKFNLTVPVVMIALGYFAVVAAVATLWRVGASAVDPIDDGDTFARPMGPRVDLEKEKRTLLKAIKEAEFDQAMGKLSKRDAEDLIRMYRARAIEIIKQLDALDAGAAAGPREQIKREVQARIALDAKPAKKDKAVDAAPKKADAKKADTKKADAKKADAKKADAKKAEEAKAEEQVEAKTDEAKTDEAKTDEAKTDEAKTDEAKADEATEAPAEEASRADDKPAKEATS